MGELAKYDPMGIDEKSEYILRGRKLLKETYPYNQGTWTYHPPIPVGWRDTYTTTTSAGSFMHTISDTNVTYLYSRPYPIQVREQSEGN